MINGEEIRANTSDVASPDPFDMFSPWVDQNSETGDASPALSDYSSCGESEFERYCSANSVMGTASMCSSIGTCNDFLDSDLGSLKSFGFEDDHVLENFGFRGNLGKISIDRSVATLGGLDPLPDDRIDFYNKDAGIANGFSMEEGMSTLRIKNQPKSLLSSAVNASSSRASCSESRDDNSMALEVGDRFQSPRSSHVITSSHSGMGDVDDSGDLISSRGEIGSVLLQSFSEHHNPQVVIDAKVKEENSIRLGVGFCSLSESNDSHPYVAVCEENFSDQVHGDLSGFPGLVSESGDPFDSKEVRTVSEEEGNSSRCEHSDDDGSMFDYGTDDEHRIGLHTGTNSQYCQEPKTENENSLLINSSVAFGSDDWEEFMQETQENNLASLLLYKPREQQQRHFDTEGNLLNSALVSHAGAPHFGGSEQEENVRDITVATCQVHDTDELIEDLESCSIRDSLSQENDLITQMVPVQIGLNIMDGTVERELQGVNREKVIGLDENEVSESEVLGKSELQLDPLSNITFHQICSANEEPRGKGTLFFEDNEVNNLPPVVEDNHNSCLNTISKDSSASDDQAECLLTPMKVENLDLKESYDEFVLEMEEILLDSRESYGARLSQSNRESLSQLPPFRDGSSTASTSGMDDVFPQIQHPLKIDGVEVVGAKQKKGDVSLGERLVGVKEYTLYILRVWSGKNQWEVERRYRDFLTLYRQLKTLFANHGWTLPSPWSYVERESRKIFGNSSPVVIDERSSLIQECLRSIVHSGSLNGTPSSLIWFLSPQKAVSSLSLLDKLVPQSTSAFAGGTCTDNNFTLGKTISLVVEIQPRKPMKQLLEAQHYTCAGCHKHLGAGKTLVQEFAETFGWGKPRLCEYTGQLFCASCHTNDTAVLPAKVLHFWDFTEYPISQLAKSYLESIYDKPMLCVSAVNPFLFSKVPALLHVMGIRKKIGSMTPYVRCPFRRSIQRGIGPRRYLLESNEFFALRDLVDLSKGAFAALPVMVETVSSKILEHITQRCLVCCDVGVPCGAKQACEDPSSLIFPFQEGEIERCSSCELVFHKTCFRYLLHCPCGSSFEAGGGAVPTDQGNHRSSNEVDKALTVSMRKPDSGSPVGFLSNLFSSTRNNNPVILMGSLPSTSF